MRPVAWREPCLWDDPEDRATPSITGRRPSPGCGGAAEDAALTVDQAGSGNLPVAAIAEGMKTVSVHGKPCSHQVTNESRVSGC